MSTIIRVYITDGVLPGQTKALSASVKKVRLLSSPELEAHKVSL